MQAKEEHFDIPLHDIKPLIEIQEYSMYYLIALGVVVAIILFALIYILIRYLKNRGKYNIRKHHLSLIKEVTLEDAKKDAYAITQYGATFAQDSQRHTNAYQALVESLESYKYKKSVESFSDETRHLFDIYKGMLDV